MKGRLRIIKIKTRRKPELTLHVHQITYGTKILSWSQEFHHKDVTLQHHMLTWQSAEKIYRVHHAQKSLILEQRGRSTQTTGTYGVLG